MLSRFSGGPNGHAIRGNVHELTLREREVAQLLAQGMSNKLIARELHLALSTAKNHVHSILEKWNVCSRGEAAARYRQMIEKDGKPSGPQSAGLRISHVPQPGSMQPQLSGPGRMLVQYGNGR
jgi:DNA-binding CsgD family transcriptional regulator